MKVAIYARVSTDHQTPDNQIPALVSLAERRGWVIAETYRERESAWRAGHQRELGRLLIDAQGGAYDAVLVWALDRLTREGPTKILTLVEGFRRHGVTVISHQEPWTEAPGELGELLFALVGWVARMESSRRSERIKAGQARAAKQGRSPGRPKGARDKQKRRTAGYRLREANKAKRKEAER